MNKIHITLITITSLYTSLSNAASFDCTKAKGYVELTICTTPELSSLDEKLNSAYKNALQQSKETSNVLKKAQVSWLRDIRNKATSASELKTAYTTRIEDLKMVVEPKNEKHSVPQPQPQPQQIINNGIYKCDKFEATTQTRQGTKYNAGYYSDNNTSITYHINDDKITVRLVTHEGSENDEVAEYKGISVDGSRKYENSSSNYYIYKLNDKLIKVINTDFNMNGTITQICKK
ncbi:TPA: DUF1311 domain-containing protein [Klebsiella pneumoniae]|uniref:lysozyme inhibitor LprI family protein n=1 Tax=Klebsiella pneumoniae TaxID=573 RepID=UPI001F4AAAEA|nr:DUF1311 domain-containing protein [Klebsiella pneumoniae]EKX2446402.1 DUF1311 domain-containing protein [Klebsiella pneumoniae]EKX8270872.1 DUF1311 domain-containing protein [Klebsiella pneumoniae]EKX9363763.1 DUF1311 domain-containing protein [Klebsiella pneumoniae]HBQ0268764.1 DUF1311 domain-containing protein [Klebsiella pneumoniae]